MFNKIKATITIKTSVKDLLIFFNTVGKGKDNYQFSSHQGIEILRGNLTKIGSIFQTREKLLFFFIKIKFIVSRVNPQSTFQFKVIDPLPFLNIIGDFSFVETNDNEIRLTLSIYRKIKNRVQKLISGIILNTLKPLLLNQIQKEVLFIKKSLEN